MKKILAILLTVCLIIAVLPMGLFTITASATTQKEAVDWLKAQDGAWYDLDNNFGAQCSDFVSAYMNWLISGDPKGGPYEVYYAYYYPTAAGWDPTSWEVIQNYPDFEPLPGDIFVSAGSTEYGHVGVVISSTTTTATIIDQNSKNPSLTSGDNAWKHDITWAGSYSPTYFIRYKNFCAKHNYDKSSVCTECGVKYDYQSTRIILDGVVEATEKVYVRKSPYEVGDLVGTYSSGTQFFVNGKVVNGYGNEWYIITHEEGNACYDRYVVASKLSMISHTCIKSEYQYYQESHPHRNVYKCSICGGNVVDYNSSNYSANCSQCSGAEISSGTYAIKNKSTGTYLNVSYSLDVNEQNVDVYSSQLSSATRMVISAAPDGYKIRPECCASRLINPNAVTITSGVNVNIFDDVNDSSQWWIFQRVSGGYVIRNVQNPNCVLDTDGGNAFVSTYAGTTTQTWALEPTTTYTVSYNMNGGSGNIDSQKKYHGQDLALSSTIPTRIGYTFLGWSTSSTATSASYKAGDKYAANQSATLYAVWAKKSYTVTYNANGGSGAPASQTKDYGQSIALSKQEPTRTGYTFLGWSTSSTATSATYKSGDSYSGNESVTLYAVWAKKSYTVTYNANGGSGAPASQAKDYGQSIALSKQEPTRTGYTFLGWSTSGTATSATYKSGDSYSGNESVTLYAVWEKTKYTITYNPNGGYGVSGTQTKTHGEDLTLLKVTPYRNEMYSFAGWSTSSTATSVTYKPGDIYTGNASITLYAVWKKNDVVIKFNANGGTGGPDQQVVASDVAFVMSLQNPTKSGLVFAGWATVASATKAEYNSGGTYSFTESTTLYAIWKNTDSYYTYVVYNGTATISAVKTTISGNITIPSKIGGYPVTRIGDSAFMGCTLLTDVTVPNCVTNIGVSAFEGCTSLKNIVLPSSLDWINGSVFFKCEKLESINIPKSVRGISQWAFRNCKSLTTVIIPENVAYLGAGAFHNCNSLQAVSGAKNVKTMEDDAFSSCDKLESFTVCEGVSILKRATFYDNVCMTKVTISKSVKTILRETFYNCAKLTDIYYTGTEAEWNAINIDYTGNNSLKNAKIHFNWSGVAGDFDGNSDINASDAIFLLYNSLYGSEEYPIGQDSDFNNDGKLTEDDAIYLLYHAIFGDEYPLN